MVTDTVKVSRPVTKVPQSYTNISECSKNEVPKGGYREMEAVNNKRLWTGCLRAVGF